ncbi:MAG TPA: hypothetical protein VHZ95_06025 [Polyangiales bacterium]|nr:hypothetical protein [Polyangiales bacterium]
MILSAAGFFVLVGASALLHATAGHYAALAAFLCMIVVYNLLRIRAARSVFASREAATRFIARQRRSHLVRGTAYLIISPALVIFVSVGLLRESPPAPLRAWIVFAGSTLFLAYGWLWWARALRRVKRWRDTESDAR